MADDRHLREMTCDPRLRNVLITDGATDVGQAVLRAVITAGAGRVWMGHVHPGEQSTQLGELDTSARVEVIPLDVTDSLSVGRCAAQIGGDVDILINTAEARSYGGTQAGIAMAMAQMDVNYFGLLRLAGEFAPAMRTRGAQRHSGAMAWVNLLSVYALTNLPPLGTFSASKAAALSLSQCLRAEMRSSGIRVVNVFAGPLGHDGSGTSSSATLAPAALAKAIVHALEQGIEDIYPGDIAQEWLARWQENPKILEREVGA